jgi:hypothetical protein
MMRRPAGRSPESSTRSLWQSTDRDFWEKVERMDEEVRIMRISV